MAIEFFVGKTFDRIPNPEGRDRMVRIFKVVGYDLEDDTVEFIHEHDFDCEEVAEDFLEDVETADLDRDHVEKSPHWEVGKRDTRSTEEKFQETAQWERRQQG
jgi:hypothetical protein